MSHGVKSNNLFQGYEELGIKQVASCAVRLPWSGQSILHLI